MICDDLSEEEIFQAYLLYASLHGFSTDEAVVRQKIYSHAHENIPDEVIDSALLAYLEDRIVAPPDVVLDRWGASRLYELDKSSPSCVRHQTCEAWFENGCRFPTEKECVPTFAHFWTEFVVEIPELEVGQGLPLGEGTRLSFDLADASEVLVSHRSIGQLGRLPRALASEMQLEPMSARKYLPLVDSTDARDTGKCKLLVSTALAEVPSSEIVQYAAEAFYAERAKC